ISRSPAESTRERVHPAHLSSSICGALFLLVCQRFDEICPFRSSRALADVWTAGVAGENDAFVAYVFLAVDLVRDALFGRLAFVLCLSGHDCRQAQGKEHK